MSFCQREVTSFTLSTGDFNKVPGSSGSYEFYAVCSVEDTEKACILPIRCEYPSNHIFWNDYGIFSQIFPEDVKPLSFANCTSAWLSQHYIGLEA